MAPIVSRAARRPGGLMRVIRAFPMQRPAVRHVTYGAGAPWQRGSRLRSGGETGEAMDLEQAIEKHAEWKLRFRSAIQRHETMDAAAIKVDNRCELGKWLHGPGKALFGSLPSYLSCVEKHARFHAEAGKVAEAINAKRFEAAEALLGGGTAYADASSAIGAALMRLKKEAAA